MVALGEERTDLLVVLSPLPLLPLLPCTTTLMCCPTKRGLVGAFTVRAIATNSAAETTSPTLKSRIAPLCFSSTAWSTNWAYNMRSRRWLVSPLLPVLLLLLLLPVLLLLLLLPVLLSDDPAAIGAEPEATGTLWTTRTPTADPQ